MKKLHLCISMFLLIAGLSGSLTAQPQYYNYNTNGSNNSFPFGIASGKEVQLLYLAGDFNQPSAAPSGSITSISFRVADTYPITNFDYTDFSIKMAQSTLTSFPASFYSPLTEVYYRSSVTLNATGGTWLTITLDTPFPYDNTQSLIIDIGQCGSSNAIGFPSCFTAGADMRRNWSVGGCPLAYSAQNNAIYHIGFNLGSCANPTSGGTIASDQSICAGSPAAAFTSTTNPGGSSGTLEYKWQVSTTGSSSGFTDIPSSNSNVYNPGTPSQTSWYKRIARVNCAPDWTGAAESNVVQVTVNPLPVPTIAGPTPVCATSTGNVYTTQAGMTGYSWSVSAGGTITAAGTNTVTVTWNTAGAQTVSVNYINGNGCTALSPTSYNITVNPLPVPTITGPASVCVNSTGNVYTTQAGMTNYIWSVPAGGTITAGGTATSNTVTVTWNTAGAQTVSVNYTNGNGCTALSPTSYNITVNPLPVPTIAGPASVCVNSTGNVYITQAGMTSYIWSVPAGGTITAGGTSTSNTVTVTWSTAGAQTVSVIYTNGNGCTALSPTSYNITVNPLPVPTIAGPTPVCSTSTGNVYTTQAGMTGYSWSVSAGGTITAGGTATSNTVTVTWNTAGARTVSVNYTNGNGCTATSPTVYNVTVNPLPVPTITGPVSACVNSTGNVYTTQAGMTGYTWSVPGGTITAGGTATSNTVTVTWSSAGSGTVFVNYTNGNGCTAAAPTVYNVTVNLLPVPTLTGPASVCATSTGNVYTTQAGMTGYTWSVSAGGTITAGGTATSNTVTVTWNTAGAQTVSVIYTNGNGCTALSPTSYNITVNPLPVPTIAGPPSVCVNSTGNVYTTQAGMTGYTWSVSAGGNITGGGTVTSNTVTVTWNTAGAQTVSVNYTNGNGCTAGAPTVYNVTVNPLPVPTIAGPPSVCATSTGNVYTTQAGMTGYTWAVPAGGIITAGGTATSNTVTVTWNTTGAQTVSVIYTNGNGCTAATPAVYNVTVNPLPVPTIAGPPSVCVTSTGNVYTTQAGMTGYTWSVSAGGTITAGGTASSNSVTVTWNSAGAQTVTFNYTNGNGCTAAAPTVFNVTVNPLPVPTITGPASVCINATGNTYSTQAGMTGYSWSVSAGGIITAGGTATSNTVTVTWNIAGPQTVSMNYLNASGCTAAAPVVYPVTVTALPAPTITGSASACLDQPGNVYTTQAGKSNYTWTVSPGGTITAGGGLSDNTITITWNAAGSRNVSVNYSVGSGCTAIAPTYFVVTVSPRPVVTLTGPNPGCAGIAGNVYSTETGMSGYAWTVSAGGTITAGGTATSSTATVTWNTIGAQTVSVNYYNANGCSAVVPAVYNVNVNALPAPTITGPSPACVGAGNVYTTQAGMTGYAWIVSAGGTITAGGTATSNTVTVTWNTAGARTVSVNYTNAGGCAAAAPVVYNVSVNAIPVPTIQGQASMCVSSGYYNYTTEPNMLNYTWTVSPGGIITYGSGTNQVQVSWIGAGAQTVSVAYANAAGCNPATPAVFNVTVNPLPDASGSVTGTATVCAGATGVAYSVAAIQGVSTYVWTLPAGATIASGAGTNSITVNFAPDATAGNITVYGNNVCGNGAPSPAFAVAVSPIPGAAGAIDGPSAICIPATAVGYTVADIAGATGYNWTVPTGATIVSGANTSSITVDYDVTTVAGAITVSGTNTCGNGTVSPSLNITVSPTPEIPTISTDGITLTSSSATGNQWYLAGAPITGATAQSYTPGIDGDYYVVVTINGCSAQSETISFFVGIEDLKSSVFSVYPIPNDGRFTVSIVSKSNETFSISIFNTLGMKIYEEGDILVNGTLNKVIDLKPIAQGVYSIVLQSGKNRIEKKILVNK